MEPGRRRLGIVGHGTYERQVLGLDTPGQVIVQVRRFLCCACLVTTSVLPDVLYPGRWYGAWVILEALVLAFALGVPIEQVRREFGVDTDTRGWRTLDRWRRELLAPLWGWLAGELGVHGECVSRDEARRRLARLLGGVGARPGRGEGARVGPLLLHGRRDESGRATSLVGKYPTQGRVWSGDESGREVPDPGQCRIDTVEDPFRGCRESSRPRRPPA